MSSLYFQKRLRLKALSQFLTPLEIISFDASATQTYGRIRAELERQGIVIGSMDMLIASQAIPHLLRCNKKIIVAQLSRKGE